jgi:hypothetical protein
MNNPDALLCAAETVEGILREHKIDSVVIGAVALAAYHYVRQTEDLDFGINASLTKMRQLTEAFLSAGFEADLREPDTEDPLGGVIDVRGSFGLVQIVNFQDRFPVVIDDAVRASTLVAREGSALRLVPIPHLIALKLYAGGYQSKADIIELITRNPELDLEEVRKLCTRYRLSGIDELIEEAD